MITWAYLAGFLDGDGWITSYEVNARTKNRRHVAGLTQAITCEPFMRMMNLFLRQKGISTSLFVRKKNWKSKIWMVNITIDRQEDLLKFLTKIKPYLVIKKEAAAKTISQLKFKQRRRAVVSHPSSGPVQWSQNDLKSLKKYVSLGWNNRMISSKLRRGVYSIAAKISRLHLRSTYVTLQQNPQVQSEDRQAG